MAVCRAQYWRLGHFVLVGSVGRAHRRSQYQRLKMGIAMQVPRDASLLRIFIGEDDMFEHKPLYEAIVLKAREMHLAGATVLRGPMGFGLSSHLHTTKILAISRDLPFVVEIVDAEEKISAFLPILDGMMQKGGLVTLEKVQVLRYGPSGNVTS